MAALGSAAVAPWSSFYLIRALELVLTIISPAFKIYSEHDYLVIFSFLEVYLQIPLTKKYAWLWFFRVSGSATLDFHMHE